MVAPSLKIFTHTHADCTILFYRNISPPPVRFAMACVFCKNKIQELLIFFPPLHPHLLSGEREQRLNEIARKGGGRKGKGQNVSVLIRSTWSFLLTGRGGGQDADSSPYERGLLTCKVLTENLSCHTTCPVSRLRVGFVCWGGGWQFAKRIHSDTPGFRGLALSSDCLYWGQCSSSHSALNLA